MRAILLAVAALLAAFLLTFSGAVALALFSAQAVEQPKIAQLSDFLGPISEASLDRLVFQEIRRFVGSTKNKSFAAACTTISCAKGFAKGFMEREADNFLAGTFGPEVNVTGIFEECVADEVQACEEGFSEVCEKEEIERSCTENLEKRKLLNGYMYSLAMGVAEDTEALLMVPRTRLDEHIAVLLVAASNIATEATKTAALTSTFTNLDARCLAFYENLTELEAIRRCNREVFDVHKAIASAFAVEARPPLQFPACSQFSPMMVSEALYQDKLGRDSKWPMYQISQAISANAFARCGEQFSETVIRQQLCLKPASTFLAVRSLSAIFGGQGIYTSCIADEIKNSTELLAEMADQEAARRGWPEI